ncbi:phage shock protein A (PspA) family protein [Streptomyces sp. DvalAA-14]|uniref:PspA/IM30 family protein n=1 Tax=unclassified Streptomyces TaxID=2593676 RepID=UPI00081BBE23|nr:MULTISPECIES: PspA/IM30 family protein [unclassified Streptomyces]MYS24944.1 PspA/IM30 family protein [Streptomyces sp. SID4948]SCE50773.1 phage shock protein A (PspA) family protein [Streptomyces sp. DvalAA-14]
MSKQTVLGRVAQLAKVNVDALLDQAEDPQKMIDRLIREYQETVAAGEDAVTSTVRYLRLMQQDHAEDVGAAAEWGSLARAASRKADEMRLADRGGDGDRFDRLARLALGRQFQCEKEAKIAEPSIVAQTDLVTTLRSGLDTVKHKLDHLQSARDELVTRSRSARPHNPPADALKDIDVLDPAAELSLFEDKLRREEAKVAGTHTPEASSLDHLFESPDPRADTAEVEARLGRLKAGTA